MRYMMTKGELGKLTLIQGALNGVYTVCEAAKGLGLSEYPANYTDEQLRRNIIALK